MLLAEIVGIAVSSQRTWVFQQGCHHHHHCHPYRLNRLVVAAEAVVAAAGAFVAASEAFGRPASRRSFLEGNRTRDYWLDGMSRCSRE